MSNIVKTDVIKANTLPVDGNTIDGMYVSAYRQPYVSPTPGELPLIVAGSVKVKDGNVTASVMNIAYLDLIKECGFNAVEDELGRSHLAKASLEACESVGIRNIVRLSQWPSETLACSPSQDSTQEAREHLFNTGHKGEEKENTTIEKERWTHHAKDLIGSWDKVLGRGDNSYKGWQKEACGGYEFDDESILRFYPWFAKLKDRIVNYDKWQSMPFINLLPQHGEANNNGEGIGTMLGCLQRRYISANEDGTFDLRQAKSYQEQESGEAYKQYLDELEKVFHPAVWCYDSYLLGDFPAIGNKELPLGQYFTDLEVIRKKALETNRPFWGTIRCLFETSRECYNDWRDLLNSKDGEEEYAKIALNFAEEEAAYIINVIGIESRTLLSYGAKGLMFWALMTGAQGNSNYYWGPLTMGLDEVYEEGETQIQKTPLYPKLQALLSELKEFGPLFLSSSVADVFHGEYASAADVKAEGEYMGFLKRIKPVSREARICMAHHQGPTGDFVVIVNTDPQNECSLNIESYSTDIEELTQNGTIEILRGSMKKVSQGGSDLVEDPFDPIPSNLQIKATIKPGNWLIFFKEKANAN